MRRFSKLGLVLAIGLGLSGPGHAENSAGSYLAARHAQWNYDFEASAQYFVQALGQNPGNVQLQMQAMQAFLATGDIKRATAIANVMAQNGINSPIASLVLVADAIKTQDFDKAIKGLEAGPIVGDSMDKLLLGWAQMGAGRVSDALATFDDMAAREGMRSFSLYHKALAIALVGDFEGAEDIFAGSGGTPLAPTIRGTIARAQVLAQQDRADDAIALLDRVFSRNPDETATALRARMSAGATVGFDHIKSAAEGAGEVFYTVASSQRADGEGELLLLFTRLAVDLAPQNVDAVLLTAELLEGLDNDSLATKAYDLVPRSHPAYVSAELGRAVALNNAGKPDAAVEVLEQLAEAFPNTRRVLVALGNTYRRAERHDAAIAVYDRAIAQVTDPRQSDWFLFFARAVSLERSDNWTKAEASFRRSLELSPNQHQVLNYLGYSFVERDENIDEAMSLIQRAVLAQPEAGYIIDSLGWVQYRMGDYEQAVVNLERAVELMATDPVVNDHLGDAFWMVGRKTEARFQWRRAQSFNPEPEDAQRISRKLKLGLDAVQAEEAEATPNVADDG